MKNTVTKNLPYSPYDLSGLEGWLEEMAAQGLVLDSVSSNWFASSAVFRREAPQFRRYRLDPVGKDYNDMERKELYQQAGWRFEDAIPPYFYIFSCDDPALPELHSDPQVLGYALDRVIRRYWLLGALPAAIMLLFPLAVFFLAPVIRLKLLLSTRPTLLSQTYYLFLTVALTLLAVSQLSRLYRARRALRLGDFPDPGRRWVRPRHLVPFLLVLLLNPTAHLGRTQLTNYEHTQYFPLEPASLSRAYPTLDQVCATGGQTVSPLLERAIRGGADHSSPAPVQEIISEVTLPGNLSPSLQAWYVEGASPLLARWILDAMADRQDTLLKGHSINAPASNRHLSRTIPLRWNMAPGSYTGFSPLSFPGYDRVSAARFENCGQPGWTFAALRGSQALVVTHTGEGDMEACLALYLETTLNG